MRLADAGVRVESTSRLGGGISALLSQVADRLERLAAGGEPEAIDLLSLPLDPADRARLHATLGEGEIRARFDADGESSVRETAVPGVWWIEHRNVRGDLVAELIEVALIPGILTVAADEARRGAQTLRARINPAASLAAPEDAT